MRNRSSCDSGSGNVPIWWAGLRVATTKNGAGSEYVVPSAVHRFEQRALRLWRRAVDLVGEDELREHGTLVELETPAVAAEHRDAEHVGRQQIARELNALITQAERLRQCVRQCRLADARHILDEQVAARQQAGEG